MSVALQVCECVLTLSLSFTVFAAGLWVLAKAIKE